MQTGDKTMMTINPFFPFTLYLTNVSTMDFLEIFYSMRNRVMRVESDTFGDPIFQKGLQN